MATAEFGGDTNQQVSDLPCDTAINRSRTARAHKMIRTVSPGAPHAARRRPRTHQSYPFFFLLAIEGISQKVEALPYPFIHCADVATIKKNGPFVTRPRGGWASAHYHIVHAQDRGPYILPAPVPRTAYSCIVSQFRHQTTRYSINSSIPYQVPPGTLYYVKDHRPTIVVDAVANAAITTFSPYKSQRG